MQCIINISNLNYKQNGPERQRQTPVAGSQEASFAQSHSEVHDGPQNPTGQAATMNHSNVKTNL